MSVKIGINGFGRIGRLESDYRRSEVMNCQLWTAILATLCWDKKRLLLKSRSIYEYVIWTLINERQRYE